MFDLVADIPEAQPIFAAATSALDGRDPRDVVASDDGDVLHANVVAQILCATCSLATWAALEPKIALPVVVAGYSVGEIAAWGVAGAMDVATVFRLVAERSRLMDAATGDPAGMVAISGVDRSRLDRIARDNGVFVAISNAADRVVLGGLIAKLDRAAEAAREAGATRTTVLPIAVASHTPLMVKAAHDFAAVLRNQTTIRDPATRLLSGVDGGAVLSVHEGLEKLARQLSEPLRWDACLVSCRSAGARRVIELGPGSALAGMMGAELGAPYARSLSDFRTIEGAAKWMRHG